MPVNTSSSTKQFAGDGTQTTFPFTFPISGEGDIIVRERVDATGVTTTKTLTTHYTVVKSGANFDDGGNVEMGVAPASGVTLLVKRSTTQTQGTDLLYGGAHDSEAYEDMVDNNTRMIQELQAQLDRCIKIPDSDADTLDMTMPNSVDRASKWQGYDADGQPTAVQTTPSSVTVTPAAETVLDDATVAAMRTTLDVLQDVFTTHGDILQEGAAGPERLAAAAVGNYFKAGGAGASSAWGKLALSDTGVHIGTNTRAAAGVQAITGVGFQPSFVLFLVHDTTLGNQNWSIGGDNGTLHCVLINGENDTETWLLTTYSLYIKRAAANSLVGLITALGADGFSITWALTGAVDLAYLYICFP